MQMDSRIILAGQTPDIMGNFGRGMQTRQMERDNTHTNAFRSMLQEQGPGIMNGDQNAFASMARFDPAAALNIQQTRQGMDESRQRLQMAYQQSNRQAQQWAQQQDEATRAREAQTLERALAMATQAQSAEQWDQIVQPIAPEYVGQFGNRDMLIAGALGVRDALTMGRGPEFRQASPDEAAQYGAAAGQFGADGRFYPINPPSGMTIEQTADGFRMVQGAGVGGAARPMTDAQSRSTTYATRARGALDDLDPIADALTSRTDLMADMVPMGAARGIQSEEFQRARIAADEFLQAILRKDTGAAITTAEMNEYGRVYLPQPGDTPEVAQMRSVARRRALAALEAGMGPAEIAAQTRALGGEISQASGGRPQAQQQPQTPAAPSAAAQSIQPEAIQMLLSDPSPESISEFDAVFGEGAAQFAIRSQRGQP